MAVRFSSLATVSRIRSSVLGQENGARPRTRRVFSFRGGCFSEDVLPPNFENPGDIPSNVVIPVPYEKVLERIKGLREQGVDINQQHVDRVFENLLDEYNEGRNSSSKEVERRKGRKDILPSEEELLEMLQTSGKKDENSESEASEDNVNDDDDDVWRERDGDRIPKGGTLVNEYHDGENANYEPFVPSRGYVSDRIPLLKQWKQATEKPKTLSKGQHVYVSGLVNQTRFNSQLAIVVGNITSDGRYPVFFVRTRADVLLLKAENLETLDMQRYRAKQRRLETALDQGLEESRKEIESDQQFAQEHGGWGGGKYVMAIDGESSTKYEANSTARNERMDVKSFTRWERIRDPDRAYEEAMLAMKLCSGGANCTEQKSSDKTENSNTTAASNPKAINRRKRAMEAELDRLEEKMRQLSLDVRRASLSPGTMLKFMLSKGASDAETKECISNEERMQAWITSIFKREGGDVMEALQGEFGKLTQKNRVAAEEVTDSQILEAAD
eukprot:jgi/Bigna1/134207/aug1.24_g8915